MRFCILLLCSVISFCAVAQQQLVVSVTSSAYKGPVAASLLIKETKKGFAIDSSGIATLRFPGNGNYTLQLSAADHEATNVRLTVPYASDTLFIELEAAEEEEEVIVQSTRTSRTIANVPTHVETIALEEIDEKSNMRPANVAMLLHESTGIQVQQTSATSGNSSIRIQGLDGRYTQLLKDGFPNYGNFSSGLSVLEIPPLDLQQVEIIKGPASPLFGGGAIAGVVNFISRTPSEAPAYNFIINQSNIGQTNVGGFAAQRGKKTGFTLLALFNRQQLYDVDGDHFTEVPESNELTVHPRLFYYPSENTTLQLGNSFTRGSRTGGDVFVINGKGDAAHRYFEENKTVRNTTTFSLESRVGDRNRFVARQSLSIFDRSIAIPDYTFAGTEWNTYTDVSYIANTRRHALVVGSNFLYNNFKERNNTTGNRNNRSYTGGIYAQHTLDASEKVKLESGLRMDAARYTNAGFANTEFFVLPRISVLFHFHPQWSSRIGAGMGYKTPTLFTEETETIQYRFVNQPGNVVSEKSYGGTADVNFRTSIGELSISLNHMFFYTIISKPLVLERDAALNYQFANAAAPVHSAGFETNAKFIFQDYFKLFLGYTFTDARAMYLSGNRFLPLVPRHKLNSALIYEKEGVLKLGLEGYFTGRQYLSNGLQTEAFKELGFMAEKIFEKFSLYINFENFTDTRQSRYKNVVNGSHLEPVFDEIWTHTEGFVFNGGVKLRL